MKKLLLVAVTAIMALSVSAQPLSKSRMQHRITKEVSLPQLSSRSAVLENSSNPTQAILGRKQTKKLNISVSELRTAQAPRKVGSIQESYDAYGKDYETGTRENWTLLSAVTTANEPVLVDVVPNPTNLEGIPVTYVDGGSTLIVLPQEVFSYSPQSNPETTYHVFISGSLTNDGSIELTLGEDGSLALGAGEQIVYGVFSTDSFDPTFAYVDDGGTYLGYYQITTSIKYFLPGEVPAPEANYAPEGISLNLTMTPSRQWFGHQFSIIPAGVKTLFKNYTDDIADTYQWSFGKYLSAEELENITADTEDLLFAPEPFGEYTMPSLVASYKGAASDAFQWCEDGELFGSGFATSWSSNFGDLMVTNANLDYNLSAPSYLATPDINSQGYSFNSIIFYQGKPQAPLYIEGGIGLYVYNFSAEGNAELKCKIVKAQRDENGYLTLGDVIAEAELDNSSIVDPGDGYTLLTWTSFATVDELGFTDAVDYLQLEDEFAVVFEGWDNGTFSCRPIMESANNTSPFTSTYVVKSDEEEFSGNAFYNLKNRAWVTFLDACYGYLYTTDETELDMAVEGDEKTIHVEPMFSASDEETGGNTTALWLADDYELPEWLSLSVANEVYSSEDYSFDLIVKAEPLPAGVEYRSEEIVLYQWGSKLVVNVTQGEVEEALTYEVDVEQEPRGNYAAEPVFDVTEVAALLNADPADLTFSLVEPKTGEPTVEYTGNPGELLFWIDQEGNNNGYNGAFVYVGYQPADKTIVVCPHPNTANDTNGKAVVRLTNAEGKYAEITLNIHIYKEIQEITRSLSENVIKARVEYETTEDSYVEKVVEITDEQVNEILADLQLESLADAEIFGWNPTTETFTDEFGSEGFDGWRDGNGDFHKWTGDATAPACVKATDGKTYYCYNIGGCDPQEIKCYYAIANDKRAVLVEVTFAYVVPAGISEVNAADQAAPVYNLNGVRMQGNNLPKGVFIQNGKKIVKK